MYSRSPALLSWSSGRLGPYAGAAARAGASLLHPFVVFQARPCSGTPGLRPYVLRPARLAGRGGAAGAAGPVDRCALAERGWWARRSGTAVLAWPGPPVGCWRSVAAARHRRVGRGAAATGWCRRPGVRTGCSFRVTLHRGSPGEVPGLRLLPAVPARGLRPGQARWPPWSASGSRPAELLSASGAAPTTPSGRLKLDQVWEALVHGRRPRARRLVTDLGLAPARSPAAARPGGAAAADRVLLANFAYLMAATHTTWCARGRSRLVGDRRLEDHSDPTDQRGHRRAPGVRGAFPAETDEDQHELRGDLRRRPIGYVERVCSVMTPSTAGGRPAPPVRRDLPRADDGRSRTSPAGGGDRGGLRSADPPWPGPAARRLRLAAVGLDRRQRPLRRAGPPLPRRSASSPPSTAGLPPTRRSAPRILVEELGLEGLLDTPVRQLSLGERMRGEVRRAAAPPPPAGAGRADDRSRHDQQGAVAAVPRRGAGPLGDDPAALTTQATWATS